MQVRFGRIARAVFLLLVVAGAFAVPAAAANNRPNALDRAVDLIPASQLLSKPAFILVDGARYAAAQRLEAIRVPLWLLIIAMQIVILAYFWRSGAAARMRDWLRRRIRSEFAVRFIVGAVLVLIAKAAALVPQYAEYRAMRAMTLVNVLSFGWLQNWLVGSIIAALVAGLLVASILWLADRTHQWYLYTIGGIFALTVGLAYLNPFLLSPAFARYSPLPARAGQVVNWVKNRTHTDVAVYEEHIASKTKTGAAYVTGIGNSERIVLSDTILQASPPGELAFVTAHEVAQVREKVPFRDALAQALTVIVSIALAIVIADRIGFRRDDDEVSRIALLGALLVATSVVILPFYYAFERRVDRVADAYASAQMGDRVSGVRYLVRRADQDLLSVCPRALTVWFTSEHEPVGARIAAVQGRGSGCATSTSPR